MRLYEYPKSPDVLVVEELVETLEVMVVVEVGVTLYVVLDVPGVLLDVLEEVLTTLI